MDRTTTIIVLAFASLVLGAIATAIFIYVIVPWRRRRRAAKEKAANPTPTQTNSPPEQPEPYTSAKRSSNVKQHSLFIIFDQPSERSDERLTEWLREKEAHYEPLKKVFLINGQQPANPITIANAFLPGELPDLFRDERGSEMVKGISLIVKPPLRKRRNQQMVVFVEIAKEAAALFNANVLDTEHKAATEETYAQIIGE
jgi:FtsZ-interacting cell division protein ZipA|tara:strand:+ start:326 stop:925 length:600 start_codon:yes stop_codon:yes gene_type:complete